MKILILCTGNSCRSQMAEGFLKFFSPESEVFSAGTEPSDKVHSKAILVMKEEGIDLTGYSPKSVSRYINHSFDYVVTVCNHAKETWPIFAGIIKTQIHFDFDDPAETQGTDEFIISEFRRIRDEIKWNFKNFYNKRLL